MILDLIQSLQTTWNTATALTSVLGSLATSRQKDATLTPYCVVDILEGQDAERETGLDILIYQPIVFNVFGTDGTIVATATDNIRAAFDFIKLPLNNSQCVICQFRTVRVYALDDKVFHGYVKYYVLTAETLPR